MAEKSHIVAQGNSFQKILNQYSEFRNLIGANKWRQIERCPKKLITFPQNAVQSTPWPTSPPWKMSSSSQEAPELHVDVSEYSNDMLV